MFKKIFPHAKQFSKYICCGVVAALVDFGSFYLLFNGLGLWYVAASITGSVLGFCTAFLCNKYLVFQKRGKIARHLGKYFLVDVFSTTIATFILFALVERFGIPEEYAKVIAMGTVVFWNFFLHKFFVYV